MPPPPLLKYKLAEIKELEGLSIRSVFKAAGKQRASTWSMFNRSIKGKPYTFDVSGLIAKLPAIPETKEDRDKQKHLMLRHRPFLVQPLNDGHPHKVYKKGRQVGVSELSVTEVLHFLDTHPGTKWVYTFPREKQLTDFSTTRINEAQEESRFMRHLFGTPNQAFLKKVNESFLFLRSAWESNLGEGVDADGVTFDEKDRMKPNIEVAFKESLSSSAYGLLREVSTPTLPGRGVDASYMNSDQQEWFVRCTKCAMWQTIEHPDNIIQMKDVPANAIELEPGTYEYRCKKEKCRGELDRIHGTWVAKHPSRKNIRGYLIPQTICPWIDATRLMSKLKEYKIRQLFENYVLAKTSIGENILLTERDFEESTAGHEQLVSRNSDWEWISAGVDWGHLNWVIVVGKNINGRKYLLNISVFEDSPSQPLESAKQVAMLLDGFQPDIVVADAGYGKDRNMLLLKRFPGKFYACYYGTNDKGDRTFVPGWQDALSKVLVNRTTTLKEACRALRDREVGLPLRDRSIEIFEKHMLALAPLHVDDEGEIYEVVESTGDDHLAHCLGYSLLGFEKLEGGRSPFSVSFM